MRVTLAVVTTASFLLLADSVTGQDALSAGALPRPTASCDQEWLEEVVVSVPGGEARPATLDSLARDVAYWFRPELAVAVRNTAYDVVVARDSIRVRQRSPAGDAAFDRASRQAVDAAAHERAFEPFVPPGNAPPLTVRVHFGEDDTGRQTRFVKRAFCWAVQRPDSPRPSFPLELAPTSTSMASNEGTTGVGRTFMQGDVEARFLVDTSGRVDPASLQILSSSHEAFTREVRRVVPLLRYFPAELGGRAAAQMVDQRFEFSAR